MYIVDCELKGIGGVDVTKRPGGPVKGDEGTVS